MGVVKAVYPTHLHLSLPGRLVGRVPINYISKAYTKIVQESADNQDDDDETVVSNLVLIIFFRIIFYN